MSRWTALSFWLLGLGILALSSLHAQELPPRPATASRPVTDDYHGTPIVDPYRWLEKTGDPEVKKWVQAQNKHTRTVLKKYPARAPVLQRLHQLYGAASIEYTEVSWQGGKLFAKSGGKLFTLKSADEPESEQVLIDPEDIAPKKDALVEFYLPSLDGKRVAASITTEGRQEGALHVYDVAGPRKLPDVIPRVSTPTMGGSLAWNADGSGFYYTRCLPIEKLPNGETCQQQHIYFHKIGTPVSEDVYSLGKEFTHSASAGLETSPDGKYILAIAQLGWASDLASHYLLGPSGQWTQISKHEDRILRMTFGHDQALYALSYDKAPRGQILRLPLATPQLKEAKVSVPHGNGVIHALLATETRLYVIELNEGTARLRVFTHDGKEEKPVAVAPLTGIEEVVLLEKDVILFRNDSYLAPPAWYRYDPVKAESTRKTMSGTPPPELREYEVVREHTRSKDGTRVPLTIVRPKGFKPDGRTPAWVTGYGGYFYVMPPTYEIRRQIWLEQGGIYVVGHLRGDGDYGEDWYRAGMLTKRQNAYDDFGAVLQHLIDRKFTSAERLAIEGGSNGGLLMGAAVTQYPEKFRAAVSWVGMFDVVRSETHPNGATDIHELGSVKNLEQFKAMHAYSPYHRVVEGKAYPAVFLLTGAHDGRCNPSDSWKMTARLQAATSSKLPVLLWTQPRAGHDLGSDQMDADVFAFLFQQLGMEYKPIGKR